MSDRLIRLVAKAIGDVDGVNAPTYEHLAKAAVAVIERDFEDIRVENDRLRAENEKLRERVEYCDHQCAKDLVELDELRGIVNASVPKTEGSAG